MDIVKSDNKCSRIIKSRKSQSAARNINHKTLHDAAAGAQT